MKGLKDAIYGLAVADAVGVPYEFKERGSFKAEDMTGYGTHSQPAGTWSDDTSMTLATCYSIKTKGRVDVKDIYGQFRKWLHNGDFTPHGNVFDVGMTTQNAIESGVGESAERSNGNGSLMRIIPLAFVPDITDEQIRAVSAITHAHKISTEACVIYVRVAQALMVGKSIADAVRTSVSVDSFYKKLLMIQYMPEPMIKSSGYVVDTLEAAIWAVSNTSGYEEAVLKAVNLGSDTDTVAAVTGALAGIIYGFDAIPKKWIDTLQNKELIDSCLFDNFKISKATEAEFDEVRDFYYNIIDMMQESEYHPAWQKDIYPTSEFLLSSVSNGELYIGRSDGDIVAAMVINHDFNEGYNDVKWKVNAEKDEVSIIHILGVLPTHSGKGFAKKMVEKAIETARQSGQRSIRLDVLGGNVPAEKLYTRMGFEYIKTVNMYYKDTGWTDFLLFEFAL